MGSLFASFGGAFLGSALVLLIFIRVGTKEETTEEKQPGERKIPKNIGMFSDPLERYERYADDDSHLYVPIKNKGVNRHGEN